MSANHRRLSSQPYRHRNPFWGWAIGVVCLLAVLAAAHGIAWYWATGRMMQALQQWSDARREEGWNLQYGPPRRAGWPFAVALDVPDVRFSADPHVVPGGFGWSMPLLHVQVSPLAPRTVQLQPSGAMQLRLADSVMPLQAADMQMQVPLMRGDNLQLEAHGLVVNAAVPAQAAGTPAGVTATAAPALPLDGTLKIRHLLLTVGPAAPPLHPSADAPKRPPALQIQTAAEDITLPPIPGAPADFATPMRSFESDLLVTGTAPQGGTGAQAATAWRDGGGKLDVRRITLRWGPLSVAASATFALDANLQPHGAASLRIAGLTDTVDALAEAGYIPRANLAALHLFVGLVNRTPPEGGEPYAELPLRLENRKLSIANAPVMTLPPINWGGSR